jgi:hypothetical protein
MRACLLFGLSLILFAGPAFGKPPGTAGTKKGPPPIFEVRELLLDAIVPGQGRITRKIRFAIPKGWTEDRDPDGRAMRLYGPNGEGRIIVAGALHPSQLTPYLDELRKQHPSAAPSPPQPMILPGVDPTRDERATRFEVTGKEIGEMVMIEKRSAIVLIVTVVAPNAWPDVKLMMEKAYTTVRVLDVSPKPAPAGPKP